MTHKPASSHSLFVKRTGDLYGNLKKRAKMDGHFLDFELEDIRRIVREAIEHAHCPFCRGELLPGNFSADHKLPISRGGTHSIVNILICCLNCNLAKGPIEYFEWRELMQVMSSWPLEIRRHTLVRLKAGAKKVKGFRQFKQPP